MIDINELRRLTQAAMPGPDGVSLSWVRLFQDFQQGASPAVINELLDRLEAAESVLRDFGTTAQEVECWLERYRCLEREAEASRARIESMEQQEPVGCVEVLFDDWVIITNNFDRAAPVYFAPGAQPAPNLPVDLITDYLVSISAHVAHRDDPKAQAEIGELLRMLAVAPEAKP